MPSKLSARMKLKFDETQIEKIAFRYEYLREESDLMGLRARILRNGCLNKEQLLMVAKWKAPRSAGHVENNTNEYVEDVTSFAFSTQNERSRIEALTILDGVAWPTA